MNNRLNGAEAPDTAAGIWATLSAIDCSEHVEEKGKLKYLSWAWAWGLMMDHYPDLEVEWSDTHYEPNGTASVACSVKIGPVVRHMWLPVMDNRNQSVKAPDSRAISDARMRCLVKCFALFGLAHYLYAGEDLPQSDGNRPAVDEARVTAEQVEQIEALIAEVNADHGKFVQWLRVSDLSELPAAHFSRAMKALEQKRAKAVA